MFFCEYFKIYPFHGEQDPAHEYLRYLLAVEKGLDPRLLTQLTTSVDKIIDEPAA